MAKGTIIFIFILSIVATLLVGINIGRKIPYQSPAETINNQQLSISPSVSPTIYLIPTSFPSPSVSSKNRVIGTSIYKNNTCGFQLTFPSSYLSQKTENEQSVILTNPDNAQDALAAACAKTIPKPPVTAEKIEAITLDKIPAMLYHDQNQDGSPRDEVIVKNPRNSLEIIIAGYGETFNTALSTFRFL